MSDEESALPPEVQPPPPHTEVSVSPAPISSQPLVHRNADKLQFIAGTDAEEDLESKPSGQQGFKARLQQLAIQVRAVVETSWRGLRGWKAFADPKKFSAPSKMDALKRARINLVFFKSNYMVIMGLITLWTILSNVTFAVSMLISAGAWKVYFELSNNGEVVVALPGGKTLRPIEAYVGLSVVTFLLFYISGGSSTVFWLVTTSIIVILGHAVMREEGASQAEMTLEEFHAVPNADFSYL
eukprot:TRINITY_DN13994_c0_g1_i1.p1 TRINITY_DN13994_c0_g1~~TRINITY_DN13994_c0_g1_i1.p1  ORF type:complete len:241 (+),score=35.59 TRINITY_DN13994_c0_g1_i1:73-795(+)